MPLAMNRIQSSQLRPARFSKPALVFISVVSAFFFLPVKAEVVQRPHIEVELISEYSQVVPGQKFWVGLRLLPEQHWHTYWRNPGDSGLPTRIEWQLPQGASAGEIRWPYPQGIDVGGLMNFGYEGEVLLLAEITAPESPKDKNLQLDAGASWLVCEKVCIPGKAELSLSIAYADTPKLDSRWSQRVEQTRDNWPAEMAGHAYDAVYQVTQEDVRIELEMADFDLAAVSDIAFFPVDTDIVENAAKPSIHWDVSSGKISIQQKKSAYFVNAPDVFKGLLVVNAQSDPQAFSFSAHLGKTVGGSYPAGSQSGP